MKIDSTWQIFEKILKYQISWLIRLIGAELFFHMNGQTDTEICQRDEAKSRFSQLCECVW